jgi:hypothetical protein
MRLALLGLGALLAAGGGGNDALKAALKDTEVAPAWVYNDLGAGFAEAKKTGKPLLVVFR